MKFSEIFVSSISITIELINKDIYYSNEKYDVFLNDVKIRSDVETNVVSLFDLEPDTTQLIRIGTFEKKIRTKKEFFSLNILDFGADKTGELDSTRAIQAAILAAPKNARLYVPAGTYLSSPLFLKSNLTIELAKNATILGSKNRDDYPILPANYEKPDGTLFELGTWEGTPGPMFASLFTGIDVENVNIVGAGTIDGNANNSVWWNFPKELQNGAWRPRTIFLNNCRNISLQGITVKNSPSWTVHPYFSKNLKFIDLYIENPKDSPNTDGLNPESCYNVEIIGVNFSVGDDCIAIKSGKMAMGMKYQTPSEKITIRNCHMAHGHGAIVLGSEMGGGIKDLDVSRCYFEDTDRGLRVKTRRGRGKYAVVDGVSFSNIYMNHVKTPLVAGMYYNCDPDGKTEYVWSKEHLPVDDQTPYLGSFTFKDIICDNVHVAAGFFYGLPEQPIGSITIENMIFKYADNAIPGIPSMMSFLEPMKKQGIIAKHVKSVKIYNTTIIGQDGEALLLEDVLDREVK